MLDKNTPRRKSVLIFCTSFFFSIRRVAFFFFLFLFLFNLAVCKLRRITYIACVRCQFCIFYSNRNRFIRTGKKECFGIFDNIEILLPIFIVYIYIYSKNFHIYNNLVCLFNIIESKLFYFMKSNNKDINKNSKLEKMLLQLFQIYNHLFTISILKNQKI